MANCAGLTSNSWLGHSEALSYGPWQRQRQHKTHLPLPSRGPNDVFWPPALNEGVSPRPPPRPPPPLPRHPPRPRPRPSPCPLITAAGAHTQLCQRRPAACGPAVLLALLSPQALAQLHA